jgi:membrane protein
MKTSPPPETRAPISYASDLWKHAQADDVSGMSAELAFRFLFALFPFALFVTALAAFIAVAIGLGNPTDAIVAGLGDNLPPDLAGPVGTELGNIIGQQRPGLLSTGALLALWSATSGTLTVIKAMNRAYGVRETRSLISRYLLGIGLTIVGSILILSAFVTIVGGSFLTAQVATQLGIGSEWRLIALLRWPVAFAILVLSATVIYRVGPNMKPSWRAALVGAVVFAVGWLVATFVFALYVSGFSNYGATYGALAGVTVLMLWLYLTGYVMLFAAEVVALIVRRTEPERLQERQEDTAADAVVGRTMEVATQTLDRLRGSVGQGQSDRREPNAGRERNVGRGPNPASR